MKKFILLTLILCIVGGAVLYYLVMWAPNMFDGDRVVVISKGETFAEVMNKLAEQGVIKSKLLFKLAGKLHGSTTRIQIGKYRFHGGMSNLAILEDLAKGTSVEAIVITIPEGMTTRRITSLLTRQVGIDSARLMALATNREFVANLGIDAPTVEGYLFPKTYRLYWQDAEELLLQQFIEEFKREFDPMMEARANELGMSIHDVLTLASIVEGETRIDSERAIIAGVYYNRLRRNMFLQADPTIQFILPFPRPLKYSDLNRVSPYNTYRNKGLPPGPVNNPGLASIMAVLYPKKHKYIFFVANGLGGHTFTKSYKEHLKAISNARKLRQERLQMQALADTSDSLQSN
ncbi:MAG: endolytic transglycosylase MltG [Bacteroidetes bacterium]|nr:MAG: endolytic transglycosylase MltG [Bacteroidota bacterium]